MAAIAIETRTARAARVRFVITQRVSLTMGCVWSLARCNRPNLLVVNGVRLARWGILLRHRRRYTSNRVIRMMACRYPRMFIAALGTRKGTTAHVSLVGSDFPTHWCWRTARLALSAIPAAVAVARIITAVAAARIMAGRTAATPAWAALSGGRSTSWTRRSQRIATSLGARLIKCATATTDSALRGPPGGMTYQTAPHVSTTATAGQAIAITASAVTLAGL